MLFDHFTRSIARVVLASYITQTLAPVVYASETMVIQRQMPKEFQPRTLHLKSPHVPLQKAAEILPRTEQLFAPEDDDRIKAQGIIRNFHRGTEPGSLMAAQSEAFQYQLHVNTSSLQDQKFQLELSRKQKGSSGLFEQLHTATLHQGKLTSRFSKEKEAEDDALLSLFKGGSTYWSTDSDRTSLFSWYIPGFATLNLNRDGRVFLNQDATAPILSSYDLVLKTSGELLIESLQVAALTLESPSTKIVGVISPKSLRVGTVIVDHLHADHEVVNQGILHVREKLTGSGKLINQSTVTLQGTKEAPAILGIRHVINKKSKDMPVDVKLESQHLRITPENHSFLNKEGAEFNVTKSLLVDSSTGDPSSFTNRGKMKAGEARLKRDATNTGSWKAHELIAEKGFTNKDELEIKGYLTALSLSNSGKIKAQKLFVKQDQFENSGSLDLEYFEINGWRFCNKLGSTLHVQKNIRAKVEEFINEGTMRGDDGLFEQVGRHFINKGTWTHKGNIYSETRIFSNTGTITWERGNWRWAPRTFFENEGKWTLKSMDVMEGLSLPRNRGEFHLESTPLVRADLHNHASGKVFARAGSNLKLNTCTNEGLIESDKGFVQIQELQNQTSGTITLQNGGTLEVEEGQNSGLIQGKDLSVTIAEKVTNEGRMVLKRLLGKKTDLYGNTGYFINNGDLDFESTENDPAIMSVPHLDNVTKEKLKKAKITGTNILVTSDNEKFRNYAGAEVTPKRLVFALPQETVFVDPALQPCLKGLPQFFNKGYISTEVLELSRNLSENSGKIKTNSFKPRGWRFQNLRGSKLDVRKSIETNLNTIQNAGKIIGQGKHTQKTGEFINTGSWQHTGDIDLGSTNFVNNKGTIAWRSGKWDFVPRKFINQGNWQLDQMVSAHLLDIQNDGILHLKDGSLVFLNLINNQELQLSSGQYRVANSFQNNHLMSFHEHDWVMTDDHTSTAANRLVIPYVTRSYTSLGEIVSEKSLTYDVQAAPKYISSTEANISFSRKHLQGRTLHDLMRVSAPKGTVTFSCPGVTTTQDYELANIGHLDLTIYGAFTTHHAFLAPVLTIKVNGPLVCGASNKVMGKIAATSGALTMKAQSIDGRFARIYGKGLTTIKSTKGNVEVGASVGGIDESTKKAYGSHYTLSDYIASKRNGAFIRSGDRLTIESAQDLFTDFGIVFSALGSSLRARNTIHNLSGRISSAGPIRLQASNYKHTRKSGIMKNWVNAYCPGWSYQRLEIPGSEEAILESLDDITFYVDHILNKASVILSGGKITNQNNALNPKMGKYVEEVLPLLCDARYFDVPQQAFALFTRGCVVRSADKIHLDMGEIVLAGCMNAINIALKAHKDIFVSYAGNGLPIVAQSEPQLIPLTEDAFPIVKEMALLMAPGEKGGVDAPFRTGKILYLDTPAYWEFCRNRQNLTYKPSLIRSFPMDVRNLIIQSVASKQTGKACVGKGKGPTSYTCLEDAAAVRCRETGSELITMDQVKRLKDSMLISELKQIGDSIYEIIHSGLIPDEYNVVRGISAQELDLCAGGNFTAEDIEIVGGRVNITSEEKLKLVTLIKRVLTPNGFQDVSGLETKVIATNGSATVVGKKGFEMEGATIHALFRLVAGSTEGNTSIRNNQLKTSHTVVQEEDGGDKVTSTTTVTTESRPSVLVSMKEIVEVLCGDKKVTSITGSHLKALQAIVFEGGKVETNAGKGEHSVTTTCREEGLSSTKESLSLQQAACLFPTVLEALEIYTKSKEADYRGTDFIADVLYDSTKKGASFGPTIQTLAFLQQMVNETPLAKSDVGCKGGFEAMRPCRVQVEKIVRLLDEGKVNLDAIIAPSVILAEDNTQRIVHTMPGIDNACGFYSLLTGHPDFKVGDNPRQLAVRKLQEGLKDKNLGLKICELLAPEIRELLHLDELPPLPKLGKMRKKLEAQELTEEKEIAWAKNPVTVAAFIDDAIGQKKWPVGYGGAFKGDQRPSGAMDALALVLGVNFKVYRKKDEKLDDSPLVLVHKKKVSKNAKTLELFHRLTADAKEVALKYNLPLLPNHFDRLEAVAEARKDAKIDEGVIKFESVLWNKDRTQIIGKLAETTYQLKQWQSSWAHQEQVIPDAALVVIALGVVIATQGAGIKIFAPMLKGITAATGLQLSAVGIAALNAGVTTVCSSGLTSLCRTGDFVQVGKDLTSSAGLKSLAISMASAGIASQVGGMLNVNMNPGLKCFTEHLQEQAIRNGASLVVNTVAGQKVNSSIVVQTIADTVIDALAAKAANNRSALPRDTFEASALHKIGHAVDGFCAGAISGLVSGEDPIKKGIARGFGCAVGETIAEGLTTKGDTNPVTLKRNADISRIVTSEIGVALGLDPNTVFRGADSSLSNNHMTSAKTKKDDEEEENLRQRIDEEANRIRARYTSLAFNEDIEDTHRERRNPNLSIWEKISLNSYLQTQVATRNGIAMGEVLCTDIDYSRKLKTGIEQWASKRLIYSVNNVSDPSMPAWRQLYSGVNALTYNNLNLLASFIPVTYGETALTFVPITRAASVAKILHALNPPNIYRWGAKTKISNVLPMQETRLVSAQSQVPIHEHWSLVPIVRGQRIEQALGQNLPQNFPTIDKFLSDQGIATSIKSIDLSAKTYQNTSALSSRLKQYVDGVAGFNGKAWGKDIDITISQINTRSLELALPHAGTTEQRAIIEQIILYGQTKGVKVTPIIH